MIIFLLLPAFNVLGDDRISDIEERMDKFETMEEREHRLLPNPKRVAFSLSKEDVSEIGIQAFNDIFSGDTKIPSFYIKIKLNKPINKIETLTFYSKKIEHLIMFSNWLKEGRKSNVRVVVEFVGPDKKITTCFPKCSIASWYFVQWESTQRIK